MIKNKERINQILINFAILFLAWSGLFRRSFNCDTLTHMEYIDMDLAVRMNGGRYLAALFDWLLYETTGMTTADHSGITVFIGVGLLTLSVGIIQVCFEDKVRCKNVYDKLAYFGLTSLLFTNVLFAEPLMFSECGITFGLAYLFASLGVFFFSKEKYLLTFFFCILSTMEYQVAVVYAAIIISAWIFLHNSYEITIKTVLQELVCGLTTFGAGVLNVISVSILAKLGIIGEVAKNLGTGGFLTKIKDCLKDLLMIFCDSKDLMPSVWLPLIIMIIACIVILYKFIKEKNMKAVFYYILLVAGMIIMIYILPLVQEGMMTPPRMVCTFYAVQAMLLLIAFICASERMKRVMCYICCGYLAIQIMFCNIIVTNHMISNTLDNTYAMMVYEKIEDYENQTGIKVEKLAVINDIDCPFSYNNVHYKTYQVNERALGTVSNTLVNVVSGRKFEKVSMDETVYETYFKGKNWDYFDASQQLIIIDDTAYWVIF